MEFTFKAYMGILEQLTANEYTPAGYKDWEKYDKTVILRHDVDFNLEAAAKMAQIEYKKIGKSGIYFVLVSTDFYNVSSKECREYMNRIISCKGEIGLHFDETQYGLCDKEEFEEYVLKERDRLADILEQKIEVVSMHRPSEKFLQEDYKFPDLINSYAHQYSKEMKYVSDSRRHWREDAEAVIASGRYSRLHILTHPVWYEEEEMGGIQEAVFKQIRTALESRITALQSNISDFDSIFTAEEIDHIINDFQYKEKFDERN